MAEKKVLTLNESLDLAVAKLPPLRKRVTERRLKNAKVREAVLDELALKLAEDDECPCQAIMQDSGFTSETRFELDLDNLEKFLQIIIKYLPTILEIVLKFLPLFMSLLFAALLSASAQAQCYTDPYTGLQVCTAPQSRPVVNVVQDVLPPYPAVQAVRYERAASQPSGYSYGSTGSAYGSSYGGSSGGSLSPVRQRAVQGYSVSSTVSYGSTGTVVQTRSYGSHGSGGSTGCPTIPVPQSLPRWN